MPPFRLLIVETDVVLYRATRRDANYESNNHSYVHQPVAVILRPSNRTSEYRDHGLMNSLYLLLLENVTREERSNEESDKDEESP